MLSPAEHRKLRYHVRARVTQVLIDAVGVGEEAIGTAAQGAMDAVREFVAASMSDHDAYELLQRAADAAAPTTEPSAR